MNSFHEFDKATTKCCCLKLEDAILFAALTQKIIKSRKVTKR